MEDVMKLRKPMAIDQTRTTNHRWLQKPVLATRLLDNMEDPKTWTLMGPGEMHFTKERFMDGTQSLRLISKTKMDNGIGPENQGAYGRPFAEVRCMRSFDGEDWSESNRLSFWVYPTLPGFKVISMYVVLHNDGEIKIPDAYDREGLNFFILEPDKWNNVVWEIASLPREKVTGVDIIYRMQGNEPYATDTVCFDIDRLELQKVEADHYEGWQVAPGSISYSHTGYRTGSSKTAIANDLQVDEFSLITSHNEQRVYMGKVQVQKTPIGTFQIMDFSDFKEEGEYRLKAGDLETKPFSINNDVWRGTIWKTINLFFCERCGFEVPGIHGVCHRDWMCEHEGQKIMINGGWHDAGDLSQGLCNTAESTYAMLNLAQKVQGDDKDLYDRLIEEGRWGLDWVLKTRFEDGYRNCWATMDYWTDGVIGNYDDTTSKAWNSPFDNFVTSATEALAYRVFKDSDPDLANYCLKMARADFAFAREYIDELETRKYVDAVQQWAQAAFAAVELYKATGEMAFADRAFELIRFVMDCQQKTYTKWDKPMIGFFYSNPEKKKILHYSHRSHSQAPLVALAELCRTFPDHEEYMAWYAALVLYSEYIRTITAYTNPYGMFPASIYHVGESEDSDYIEQVKNGIPLSQEYYLRMYPVWFTFRGNYSLMLSDAKALSSAASVRRNLELLDMCQRQLEWVVGRNPFVQSTMYGEGYDYAPQYTAMSGDMVGSLPVGMLTSRNKDVPYWPFNNCYNYKEVWVQPSARWLWLMQELSGTAKICGTVGVGGSRGVKILDTCGSKVYHAVADAHTGDYEISLPEGRYKVIQEGWEKDVTVLPGETHQFDLETADVLQVVNKTVMDQKVQIQLEIKGQREINLEVRTSNLAVKKNNFVISPTKGEPSLVTIEGEILQPDGMWVLLLVPNGNMNEKVEVIGCSTENMLLHIE